MADIVERLRDPVRDSWDEQVMDEAADEIERNRAAIAELVYALKEAAGVLEAFKFQSQTAAQVLEESLAAIAKHEQPERPISERHAHGVFW